MPSISAEMASRSLPSSTPAVFAASIALDEIGSQPPNTMSSSSASGTNSLISGLRFSSFVPRRMWGHLRYRTNRRGNALAGSEYAGDERGGNSSHAGGEDAELAGGGCDVTSCHAQQSKQPCITLSISEEITELSCVGCHPLQSRFSLPDISIRQLEYLIAVADAPTWKVAADRVGVSASALSQGLAELERRIGVQLFEAHGRRRVLRTTCRPVLDHARLVVTSTSDLVDWARRLRTAATGRVRLGMIDVAAVTHFPRCTAGVSRRAKRRRPSPCRLQPSRALLSDLKSGALDLAVCVEPTTPDSRNHHYLTAERATPGLRASGRHPRPTCDLGTVGPVSRWFAHPGTP